LVFFPTRIRVCNQARKAGPPFLVKLSENVVRVNHGKLVNDERAPLQLL
jgi:hypothetical protein